MDDLPWSERTMRVGSAGSIPVRSHGHLIWETATRHHTANRQTLSEHSVMATLQSKGSIISRTSFQALDIEEPESEEEPEVVELQQAE